jgi:glycerophosphoryl diester phosphodiesterase
MPVEALHPERTLTEPDQVAAARRAGRVINVWTVNDENEARALSALGVDGIITDRPGPVGEAARSV